MTETASHRPIQLVGIAGSLRRGSYNRALLHAAVGLTPPGVALRPLALADIPLYDGDLEDAEGLPEPVRLLRDRIRAADGLLIVTPEYNAGVPGVLKNALDWASRPPDQPFEGKPAAIIGGGGRFGTARAQINFAPIATALGLVMMPTPALYVAQVAESFDADGRLIKPETETRLAAVVAALAAWSRRFVAA